MGQHLLLGQKNGAAESTFDHLFALFCPFLRFMHIVVDYNQCIRRWVKVDTHTFDAAYMDTLWSPFTYMVYFRIRVRWTKSFRTDWCILTMPSNSIVASIMNFLLTNIEEAPRRNDTYTQATATRGWFAGQQHRGLKFLCMDQESLLCVPDVFQARVTCL